METVAGLRDTIVQDASMDVSSSTALSWLNRSWRRIIGEARAYRLWIDVGDTVAGTGFYPVPGVLEVFDLRVAGVPYTRARRGDSYSDQQGRLSWTWMGEIGLFEPGADATAARGVTLIPEPETSGLEVLVFAATVPPELTADTDGDDLLAAVLDGEEISMGLVGGALEWGYMFESNVALADRCANLRQADTEKLAGTTRSRFRGPGAAQIRLA